MKPPTTTKTKKFFSTLFDTIALIAPFVKPHTLVAKIAAAIAVAKSGKSKKP